MDFCLCAGEMYASIVPALGWIVLLVILAFAFWKGGAPERLGTLAIFLAAVVVWAIEHFSPPSIETLLLLAGDGLLAVAFLILAVRYASLWLGIAMIFQAVQFGLHAVYVTGELALDRRYVIVNNAVTLGIMTVVLFAITSAWLRRRARRRAALQQAATPIATATPTA